MTAAILLFSVLTHAQTTPYLADTLIINVPDSEIQKNPIWQRPGAVYDSFLNVPAFSNSYGGDYQCTELAHRFLNETYGIPTRIGMGLGNGNTVVQNIFERFGLGVYTYENRNVALRLNLAGTAAEPPAAGSILNFASGKMGHVAVIRFVQVEDATHVRVYLFEQHGFPTLQPGQAHGLRQVVFAKNSKGAWSAPQVAGIGQALSWLNFKLVD